LTSAIDYTAATRNAEHFFSTALDSWKDGLASVSGQFRDFPAFGTFPQVDVTELVERQYAFIRQVVEVNHQYALKLAEVATTLNGVTRQQLETVSGAVRDQVQGVSDAAQKGADTLEETVRDQADQAEEAERQKAREAAAAERRERKEARDKARERYQGLTKTELADQAAQRDLPKTGTVEELVERLVDSDTK
jgi:hypothetical protein